MYLQFRGQVWLRSKCKYYQYKEVFKVIRQDKINKGVRIDRVERGVLGIGFGIYDCWKVEKIRLGRNNE